MEAYLVICGELYDPSLVLITQPLLSYPHQIQTPLPGPCLDHGQQGRNGQTGIQRSRQRPMLKVSQTRDATRLALLTTLQHHGLPPVMTIAPWILPASWRVAPDRACSLAAEDPAL